MQFSQECLETQTLESDMCLIFSRFSPSLKHGPRSRNMCASHSGVSRDTAQGVEIFAQCSRESVSTGARAHSSPLSLQCGPRNLTREAIDLVHSEGVYEIVPMQECRNAGMKPLYLICVDRQVCGSESKKIRSRLRAREYKTKKQGKIQRALPASQLFYAMPPLEAVKVLVSISVSLSNKGKPLKLRHTTSAEHISKDQPRDSFKLDHPQRIVRSMAKTKLVD